MLKCCASCLQFNYSPSYSRFSEANPSCEIKQYKINSSENPYWILALRTSLENAEGPLDAWVEGTLPQSPVWRSLSPQVVPFSWGSPNDATNTTYVVKPSKTLKSNFASLSTACDQQENHTEKWEGTKLWRTSASNASKSNKHPPDLTNLMLALQFIQTQFLTDLLSFLPYPSPSTDNPSAETREK